MAQRPLSAILRNRIATALTLLVAVAAVALTVLFIVREAPDGTRELDAYATAPRCPAAPSEPAACRWTQQFTVSEIHLTSKRGELDGAVLTDANGTRWKTSYTNRGPVLGDLGKGDRVTGTVWRGRVTEIAAAGDTQDTYAAPNDLRARYLIAGLVAVPPCLLIAAACAWRLGRRAAPNPTPGMIATFYLGVAVFFAGLVCPLLTSAAGEDFWITAAVWLPLTALLTAMARIYVTQKRTRTTTRTASSWDGPVEELGG